MTAYKASTRHAIALRAFGVLSLLCIGSFVSVPQAGAQAAVHVANSNNVFANSTDMFELNSNGNTLYFVTSNYNPDGYGGTFENHALGVYFDWIQGYWAIFNQDNAAMPVGAAFNVAAIPSQFTGTSYNTWVHTATAANSAGDYTNLENTNGLSSALVWVTPNWNPGGAHETGIFDNHVLGVSYTGKNCTIYHQDGTAIPVGASYNVMVAPYTFFPLAYVHTATTSNSSYNATFLDNWILNDSPNHIVIVSQNYNPTGSASGIYNNHNIGVVYVDSAWAIYNQDGSAIPAGASFNVWVVQ